MNIILIYTITSTADVTNLRTTLINQETPNYLAWSSNSLLLLFIKYGSIKCILGEWQFNFHHMGYRPSSPWNGNHGTITCEDTRTSDSFHLWHVSAAWLGLCNIFFIIIFKIFMFERLGHLVPAILSAIACNSTGLQLWTIKICCSLSVFVSF